MRLGRRPRSPLLLQDFGFLAFNGRVDLVAVIETVGAGFQGSHLAGNFLEFGHALGVCDC